MIASTGAPTRSAATPFGLVQEVAEGVYAYVQGNGGWCLSNAGIILGPEETIIVDTAATQRRTQALLAAVDRVAPARHRVAINTHSHGDHTLGNCLLPEDVPIFAHPAARDEMSAAGLSIMGLWPMVEWGDLRVRLPTRLIPDSATIGHGTTTTEIRHLGVSHTTNDLVAWLPRKGVLFAGDQVLSRCTPFLLFGSVLGAKAALIQLRRLEPRTVVPGHGPVGGVELIAATLRYLDWVIEVAQEGLRSRKTAKAVAHSVGPGPFPEWIDSERHVANFHRAYLDLEGAAPGAPLDLESVFRDVSDCCEHGYPVCLA